MNDADRIAEREAQFPQVRIRCECGNEFEVPCDAAGMVMHDAICGHCGEGGKMSIARNGSNEP